MFGIPINNRDTALEWLKSQGKVGYVRIFRAGSKDATDRVGEDGLVDGGSIVDDVKIRLERLPYGNYQLRCASAKNATATDTVYEFVNVSVANPQSMYGAMPGWPGGFPPQMGATPPAITEADVDRRIKEALEKKEKNDRIKDLEKQLKEKNKELKQKEEAIKQGQTIGRIGRLGGLALMNASNPDMVKLGLAISGLMPEDQAPPKVQGNRQTTRQRTTEEEETDDTEEDDDEEPETDMDARFDEAVVSLTEKGMTDEQICNATETIGSLADKIGVEKTDALMQKIGSFTDAQLNAYLPMILGA